MNEIKQYNKNIFESIKHIDENGNDYWCARELQKVLQYAQWRRFNDVINRSIISCNMVMLMLMNTLPCAAKR